MKRLVVVGSLALVALGITGAWASIPDPSGVIHGCYKNSNPAKGAVIVIDTDAGETCPSGTTALNWSQTGPQGPPGPAGTTVIRLRGTASSGTTIVDLGTFVQPAAAVATFSGQVTPFDCVTSVSVLVDDQRVGGLPSDAWGLPLRNSYIDFVPSNTGEKADPFLFEPGIDTVHHVVATITHGCSQPVEIAIDVTLAS